MSNMPITKYRPYAPVVLPDRRWPSQVLTKAPAWCSVDLRDGNQALIEPMGVDRKNRMFDLLVKIGFKEIEVAFPAASQTDFDFVRDIIDDGKIPDDVAIQVLTQCRPELIERTFEAVKGAKNVILHFYNSTSTLQRDVVFRSDRAGITKIATDAAEQVKALADQAPETNFIFEYSPESFTGTELEYALEICEAVKAIIKPTPTHKLILNLPATVEMATPNVYADQFEWFGRNISDRDSVLLSIHPHNDRGSAVAAAELALMAGADRVEGTLFGNGERTGNVDVITMALNLFTQGIDPKLDLHDINEIRKIAEYCTQLPVHERHPYAGDLVYTAFSGSHQDAIKKGFAVQRADAVWEMPYLPIDPSDLGRTYDSIIRVNSQSGKGGIAYLLEQGYGVALPRRLQVDFSAAVQRLTDDSGHEVTSAQIWSLFQQEYVEGDAPLRYVGHELSERDGRETIVLTADVHGERRVLRGEGNGPLDALMHALRTPLRIQHYEERALSQGADAKAIAIAELAGSGVRGSAFGVGIDANLTTASIRAVISGVNRAYARADEAAQATFFGAQAAAKAVA